MKSYNCICACLLFAVIFASAGDMASAEEFIVEEGKANAEIIISPEPARTVKFAAKELQHYIKKISGAELPVLNKPSGEADIKIYLGESEYTKKLGLLDKEYEKHSFRIMSGKDYLAIVGKDKDSEIMQPCPKNRKDLPRAKAEWDKISGGLWAFIGWMQREGKNKALGIHVADGRGTLYGVYDFLRSLGVRWYFPGEFGECVPEMKSIKLPEIDKTVVPDFTYRHFAGRSFKFNKKKDALWILRLGLGKPRSISVRGHGINNVLHVEKSRKLHPEWYRLTDGERENVGHGRPCLSAKGLREEVIKFGRVNFDLYKLDSLSIAPTDGFTFICQCDLCRGKDTPERGFQGSMSDYVWDYYKEVATALYKTHPDKMVTGLAYNTYVLPPTKIDKMPPNFSVMFSHNRYRFVDAKLKKTTLDTRNPLLEKLTSDKGICHHDNYSFMGRSPFPMYIPRIIAEDIRLLKGKAAGSYIEDNSREIHGEKVDLKFAILHLNIYVTARMWWDADQDIDELLNEYYEKFYGPASKEMKAFIEFSEANWAEMKNDVSLSNKALELIETAKGAVDKETIYGQRVYLVDTYLDKLRKVKDEVAIGRSENTPVVMVDKSGKDMSVTLDGKFEEDFWKDAKTYYLRNARTGEKPEFATSFRTVWKDDKLYLAIHCEEADTKNFNIGTTKDDHSAIWNGETLEIFFETQNHAFYQIVLNPAGALLDADQFFKLKTLWSSEAKFAVDTGEDYWNVEMEFPIAGAQQEEDLPDLMISGSKPTKDRPWHINVCRSRNRGKGKSEASMFGRTDIKGKLFLNRDRFCPFYIEE